MTSGDLAFRLLALRRADAADSDEQASGARSIGLGVRLVRLIAEAPPGCRLTIRTRGTDDGLSVVMQVSVSPEAPLPPGLPDLGASVTHLAEEISGLLSGAAAVGPIERAADEEDVPTAALAIRPRDLAELGSGVGFVQDQGDLESGSWGIPRAASPEDLARLLLAHPHVHLVQVVESLSEQEAEDVRESLAEDLHLDAQTADVYLGVPVKAAAALIARTDPGTLPLRFHEHLRGWFTAVDIDVVKPSEALVTRPVPESVAGGLLRIPATVSGSFPGMHVEPQVVAYQGTTSSADGLRVGRVRDERGNLRDLLITPQVLSRHVHIIGETGSGKSTAMTQMAVDAAARGEGFLFLDPHGQTVDRIVAEMTPDARERTWLIRCGDLQNPVRLNPLAVGPQERDLVIGDLVEAFQQLFDPRNEGIVGPRFQRIMRNVLASLSEVRGARASLLDVPRVLERQDMAKALFDQLTDPDLKAFWANDILTNRSSELQEVIAWVTSKFTSFAMNPALRGMLETGADSFDPVEAMRDRRIVLVDLAKGQVGITGARILGMLYLLRYWGAALSGQAQSPSTLYIDEAGSFSSVPLAAILSEGRKFGLGAVMAHQYMRQLPVSLREAVDGSVATRFIFRVGGEDARNLAVSTLPEFGPLDLSGLPQFLAAARLAASGTPRPPFTLEVDYNSIAAEQPDATAARQQIRARTIEELVDPYRDLPTLTLEDLNPDEGSVRSRARRRLEGRASYIDEWLERRRARDEAADLQDMAPTASDDLDMDEF